MRALKHIIGAFADWVLPDQYPSPAPGRSCSGGLFAQDVIDHANWGRVNAAVHLLRTVPSWRRERLMSQYVLPYVTCGMLSYALFVELERNANVRVSAGLSATACEKIRLHNPTAFEDGAGNAPH